MAKLPTKPVTAADLDEYLSKFSDFVFEVSALNVLTGLGFECEHGGSYMDPFTQKPREFDLRAVKSFGPMFLRFAVECKNLRDNFPLLISRLPRRGDESYHEVVRSFDREQVITAEDSPLTPLPMRPQAKTHRISSGASIYPPGEFVGKSMNQVGRDSSNSIVANDAEVYPKWAQAISSAQELVDRSVFDAEEGGQDILLSIVIPILLVPDGMLWTVDFDSNGRKVAGPQRMTGCSYYVGMCYFGGDKLSGTRYSISHLEILTPRGIDELVSRLTGNKRKLNKLFRGSEVIA